MVTGVLRAAPGTGQQRLPLAATLGLAGIAVPLIGGKWGAYIGVAPVYLADALILGGALLTLLTTRRFTTLVRFSPAYWLLWTSGVVFIAAAALLGTGAVALRLRDLIPWLYLLVVPMAGQWLVAAGRARLQRYLLWTLLLHAAWAIPAMLLTDPDPNQVEQQQFLPFAAEPFFGIRTDIDVPLVVLAVVVAMRRWGLRPATLALAAGALAATLSQTSRAAMLASLVGLAVYGLVNRRTRGPSGLVKLAVAGTGVALVLALALPVLATTGLFGVDGGALARAGLLGGTGSDAAASGDYTWNDRLMAWQVLGDYYTEQGSPPFGFGPGAEVIRDSGAVKFLSGHDVVRSPHNWWVGGWVRAGPAGMGLWLLLLAAGTRPLAGRRRWKGDHVAATGWFLVVSVLVAASAGVLIESPFGSHALLFGIALVCLPALERLAGPRGLLREHRPDDPA